MTLTGSTPPAFHGSPRGGRWDRWVPALVLLLVVAFVGLAIAKPWGSQAAPTPAPSEAVRPPASIPTTGPQVVAGRPSIAPPVGRSPIAPFTTSAPPPPEAGWTALRWRRLTPDDPLGLVTSVVRWRGGYVATGWMDSPAGPVTPVWTSGDGTGWTPVTFGEATTFWPGAIVLGVVELRGGLVAFTEQAGESCPVCAPLVPPVVAWTSADGRAWRPHTLPAGAMSGPAGTAPLIARGPAAILVASPGTGHRVAISADGVRWSVLAGTMPAAFVLDDLRGTATGYVAGGRWLADATGKAAVLRSADGRSWTATRSILPAAAGATGRGSTVDSLVVGEAGAIAIGHAVGGAAATLWWQSSDERSWRRLDTYPPLGSWSPSGAALRSGPHGWLLDDGRRIVAVRGGPQAGAWTSDDGLAWQRLGIGGDVPGEHAAEAVLLPGGVLLREGSAAWFGEAVTG